MAHPPHSPRRILMTADAVGGVWHYALELAAGLGQTGTETILAVMGPAPGAAQRRAAARVPGLRLHHADYALEWMPGADADLGAAGDWLLGLERRYAPAIVHLNGYAHACLPWRAPCLIGAHSCVESWWRAVWGSAPPPEWAAYRTRVAAGLAAARAVVAPTRAFLETLRAIYGPLRNGRVIRNGRDPAGAPPAAKQPVILAAGRVWDEAKNIAALDRAAASLDWPVEVAGEARGPDGRLATFDHAVCLGPLAPDALAERLRRAAIFASPARYEPFGLAVLEAAQSGCALVLSDIGSFRELWDGAALFVPPDDAGALRDVLHGLTRAPDQVAALGAAAARRARAYGAAPMLRAYRRLYADLLAEGSAARRPDLLVTAGG